MWPVFEDLCVVQRNDSSFTYEVIVVDDGSKDSTSEVIKTQRLHICYGSHVFLQND